MSRQFTTDGPTAASCERERLEEGKQAGRQAGRKEKRKKKNNEYELKR